MSEKVVESASGALRLRLVIERADLFTMTDSDRAGFDAVLRAVAALGTRPVPADAAPAPTELPVSSSASGLVSCSLCGRQCHARGLHRHEAKCRRDNDPGYAAGLRARAAAPPPDEGERPAVLYAAPPPDGLEEAVRATGAIPGRMLGALTRGFLRDVLGLDDDGVRRFLTGQPERHVATVRRECGLDEGDSTLEWLLAFRDQHARIGNTAQLRVANG